METTGKASILVVDDEETLRKLVCVILKNKGYETMEAANGAEAVKMYKEQKPDLTLMDLMMPEMDGYEAIKQIKEYDPDARILVVSVKGYEPESKYSAVGVLKKPFAKATLLTEVEEMLKA